MALCPVQLRVLRVQHQALKRRFAAACHSQRLQTAAAATARTAATKARTAAKRERTLRLAVESQLATLLSAAPQPMSDAALAPARAPLPVPVSVRFTGGDIVGEEPQSAVEVSKGRRVKRVSAGGLTVAPVVVSSVAPTVVVSSVALTVAMEVSGGKEASTQGRRSASLGGGASINVRGRRGRSLGAGGVSRQDTPTWLSASRLPSEAATLSVTDSGLVPGSMPGRTPSAAPDASTLNPLPFTGAKAARYSNRIQSGSTVEGLEGDKAAPSPEIASDAVTPGCSALSYTLLASGVPATTAVFRASGVAGSSISATPRFPRPPTNTPATQHSAGAASAVEEGLMSGTVAAAAAKPADLGAEIGSFALPEPASGTASYCRKEHIYRP